MLENFPKNIFAPLEAEWRFFMNKENKKNILNEKEMGSRLPNINEEDFNPEEGRFDGFSSRREMILASIHNYLGNSKIMMLSSLSHLRSPITIFTIILLIAVYIMLGVAGTVEFSFYSKKVVQYITTNLDIVVNALLGFFYGPVTCCISVTLCCLVRMIATKQGFFIGYVITATVAGFMHGWILYRHKTMWFGTRFRGFFTDLLAKSFATRLMVSLVVNIFLKALIYKIFINYPIHEFIMRYSKSGVELTSYSQFFLVFVVSLVFETAVIFLALAIINFIAAKAFPAQYIGPDVLFEQDEEFMEYEDEMILD